MFHDHEYVRLDIELRREKFHLFQRELTILRYILPCSLRREQIASVVINVSVTPMNHSD